MASTFRVHAMRATFAAASLVAAAAFTAPTASAGCVNKAGEGSGSDQAAAKFQAWEAVLQATSWPMWSKWISGKQVIGTAPDYKVTNVGSRCSGGAGGQTCRMQATLCN